MRPEVVLRRGIFWSLALAVAVAGCGEQFSTQPATGGASNSGGATAAGGQGAGTSTSVTSGSGGAGATTSSTGGTGQGGGGAGWPAPTELAFGEASPWGITVDPSAVYWTNEGNGTIRQLSFGSGEVTTVATGTAPRGIGDWAGIIAWADPGQNSGCRASTANWNPACVGTPGAAHEDAAVSVSLVAYFTAPGAGTVESWDGSASGEIASGQASPAGIAVDALYIYWANAGSNRIMRSTFVAAAPQEFAVTSGPPQHVVSTEAGVFWTVPTLGIVEGRTLTGTPVTVSSNEGTPWDITSDGQRLYWTDRTQGRVRAARTDAGGVITIAVGLEEPLGITVSATAVLWTDHSSGTIWKVDRLL